MTQPYDATSVYPHAGPLGGPRGEYSPRGEGFGERSGSHDEFGQQRSRSEVRAEKPQNHPIAYASLVLALSALAWLTGLSLGGNHGYQTVQVGTQACLTVPQDHGPAALYCPASGVSKTP